MTSPRPIRLLPLLVLLGSLLAPAGAVAKGPALRGVQLLAIGQDTPVSQIDSQLNAAKRARANIVRIAVNWSELEPEAPGRIEPRYLAAVDRTITGAGRRGMKVMLTLGTTPCWASAAPEAVKQGCAAGSRQGATRYPPADPADYARAARYAASRWGSRLGAFEVWNEPDQANELYFAGPDKVNRYAAILRAAYPAVKGAAPKVPVLGGALVGKDGRFLEALYQAGIKGSYDILSVHFYDLILDGLQTIRQVQKRNGDSKPLWLGEFGWSSCLPKERQGPHICVSRRLQGQNLLDTMRALRTVGYVRGAIVFSVRDNDEFDFGVLDRSYRAKPALAALRKGFSRKPGRARRPTLRLSRSGGSVVAAGSGPAGGYYELDVLQGTVTRYRVAFRLDRDNRYRLVLPAQLGTSGLRVKVFQAFLRKVTTKRI